MDERLGPDLRDYAAEVGAGLIAHHGLNFADAEGTARARIRERAHSRSALFVASSSGRTRLALCREAQGAVVALRCRMHQRLEERAVLGVVCQ